MGAIDRFKGWNRRRIAARRMAKPPVATPFGFVMNGNAKMLAGTFEPEETSLVRSLLAQMDRFVNVGANTGYYCLFASQAGVPTIAFEPVQSNVTILVQNLKANGFGNVTLLPVAVGERAGFADIYGVGTGSSFLEGWAGNPESTRQTVPVVTLSEIVSPPEHDEKMFILVDVEGFEYFALKGAGTLINAANKPVWLIEIVGEGVKPVFNPDAQAVFDLMLNSGYSAYTATGNRKQVSSPQMDETNYLFISSEMSVDDVIDGSK